MRAGWTASLTVVVALAAWLAAPPSGSGVSEGDGDGVPNSSDNCVIVPNGPLGGTGSCIAQEDGDMDGYGNICDTDYNNDGATGLDDVAGVLARAAIVATDPVFDPNCDGATGLDDVARTLGDAATVATPGPSGLACAGNIPCP